jgi:hypothetical protein
MGSSQSNLPTATSLTASDDKTTLAAQPAKQPVAADAAVNDDNGTTNNKKPKKERKGYDLVQYKCRRRKAGTYHPFLLSFFFRFQTILSIFSLPFSLYITQPTTSVMRNGMAESF